MARVSLRKIIAVGDSYCITIPKSLLAQLGLVLSDYVTVRLTCDKIEIRKFNDEWADNTPKR